MAQDNTTIPAKSPGDTFSAAELNELDDAVNNNATDAESRLTALEGAGGSGGLTQTAGGDADTAMAVGNNYVVDMSAWATADRVYSLPSTAAVGDQVGITITAGNATYDLDMQTTAASNDTINGVDHDSTPWSKLFQTGETVVFECVTANTDWVVVNDGRIPCSARVYRSATSQTGIGDATLTNVEFNQLDFADGITADTSSAYSLTMRRAGKYKISSITGMENAGLLWGLMRFYIDGAVADGGTMVSFTTTSTKSVWNCYCGVLDIAAGSYCQIYVYMDTGSGTMSSVANVANPNHFTMTEIL